MRSFYTVFLLIISNIFMTFAWYGHLKFKESSLPLVVLVSWVFFRADTLGSALSFLDAMAGAARPTQAVPGVGMFVDTEVVAAGLLGIIGSAPIFPAPGCAGS